MSTAVTLQGNIRDLIGVPEAAVVTISLCNFGSAQPYTGDGALGNLVTVIRCNSLGQYSQGIYANSQITPVGTVYEFVINGANGSYVQTFSAILTPGTVALEQLIQIGPVLPA